jgi:hypothetical protein
MVKQPRGSPGNKMKTSMGNKGEEKTKKSNEIRRIEQ